MSQYRKPALDFIEEDILYCWGCASYPETLKRLNSLHSITVDPDIQEVIKKLELKHLVNADKKRFEQLFCETRYKLEDMHRNCG